MPAAYAAWKGRKLKVDNTCEATIVGFAVVSRLAGDPGYASHEAWDTASGMADGHRMLAAKLDHCKGTFARSAALPDVAILTRSHDAALEQAAIEAVIASEPARETERAWREQGQETGGPVVPPWRETGTMTTEVLRHPGTGEIFVSVHALVAGGCGASEANVWGLFRVVEGLGLGASMIGPISLRGAPSVEVVGLSHPSTLCGARVSGVSGAPGRVTIDVTVAR